MTTKDAIALQPGTPVVHSFFGLAKVVEVKMCVGSLFGIVIRVDTDEGRRKLEFASGMPGDTAFLEDSPRRLKLPC